MSSMISIKVFAVVLFIVGAALRYWMNRRRFNRNNFAGVQTFKSYEHKTGIESVEYVLRKVAWVLILAGIFLYVMVIVVHSGPVSKKKQEEQQAINNNVK
ncbi:hypothetical protein [Niabella hirudinis]|uniref:hypothetical protein n=1 Tax=Niabella hirudinis TaxID=1285929 RepID=UPI003EB9E909